MAVVETAAEATEADVNTEEREAVVYTADAEVEVEVLK